MLSRSINTFLSVGLSGWTVGRVAGAATAHGTRADVMSRPDPARGGPRKAPSFGAPDIRISQCGGESGGDCPNGRKPGPE